MTVTVADDSMDNVSITVNDSIVDIAGNPLIEAVDNLQTVDTVNPTASYSSEILTQENQSDDVSSDDDSVVAYTVDFSEPVSGITAGDIRVDGGAVVAETIALSSDGLQATFNVQANDDSVANLVVTVKDTVTDLNGNRLVESSSAPVSVDTENPEVTIADDQSGIAFDGANTVEYTLTFSEAVQSVTEGDLTVSGAESFSVAHTADTDTAYVTVTVADDSMDNVSITVNDSIVDIAGNPLIEAVDNLQTVDTRNPSTVGAPAVSDVLVTDTDDGTTLTVTFGFDEAMDQGIAPAVTFDPAVASTLTSQAGRWTDAQTYVVDAVVADAGVDADAVTINITGAHDVAGNLQVDHTAYSRSGSRH